MKLALETCVPPVTNAEMEDISHLLKIPGDKREGQVIASYDRVYTALKRAGVQHGFPVPSVFEPEHIDRRSSTYFNSSSEVRAFCNILYHRKLWVKKYVREGTEKGQTHQKFCFW